MKTRRWCAFAALFLAVTSCAQPSGTRPAATSVNSTAPGHYSAVTSDGDGMEKTPPVPAAGSANHALTVKETLRLAALAGIPANARQLATAPRNGPNPGTGIESTTSRVDSTTYWAVPMSATKSDLWVRTHAPHGLPHTGSGGYGGTSQAPEVISEVYGSPQNSAWSNSTLEITFAPAGADASVWRVDGVATWLNPVPIKDTATGHRIHVTVADGCPESDKDVVGVTNPSIGLQTRLVPDAAATSALICRYVGMNGPTNVVQSHQDLTGAAAAGLGRKAREATLSYDSGAGAIYCPADDNAMALVVFSYPDGSSVDLWQKTTGCTTVSNGYVTAQWGLD
jgi:hypothetical protein